MQAKFGVTNSLFSEIGTRAASQQHSFDLFVFTHKPNQYRNIATLAELARKTSGSLYFYSEYEAGKDAMKLTNELYTCLTRE